MKPKKATQRACDEKDAKGKLCCDHLKRWYDYPKEIEALVGKKAEVYRCEFERRSTNQIALRCRTVTRCVLVIATKDESQKMKSELIHD